MTDQTLVTAFAALTSTICLITLLVLAFMSFQDRMVWMTGLMLLGVLTMAWFAVVYLAVLAGININTALYLRAWLPVLASLFTFTAVLLYHNMKMQRVRNEIQETLQIIEQDKKVLEGIGELH